MLLSSFKDVKALKDIAVNFLITAVTYQVSHYVNYIHSAVHTQIRDQAWLYAQSKLKYIKTLLKALQFQISLSLWRFSTLYIIEKWWCGNWNRWMDTPRTDKNVNKQTEILGKYFLRKLVNMQIFPYEAHIPTKSTLQFSILFHHDLPQVLWNRTSLNFGCRDFIDNQQSLGNVLSVIKYIAAEGWGRLMPW